MTSYRVFRDVPSIPHRQYVRRVVNSRHVLWHRDAEIAHRFNQRQASNWSLVLQRRSTGYDGTQGATEPAGHYGYEEVTT